MKLLKKITSILSAIFLIALFVLVVSMQLYPEDTSRFIGYRFYTVLTNSMEPVIPTYSLVFSKMIDEDDPIPPNTIVTFQANRFGEDILLTHYFRETQIGDDGNLYYRTQGATAPDYDNYETSRSDIIGTYVFHIPYLGKVFLFLKSKFGFIMYAELFVIWLVNQTIKTRWDEKAQEKRIKKKRPFAITELSMEEHEGCLMLTGYLENRMKKSAKYVVAKLTFFDSEKNIVKEDKWYLVGREPLKQNEKVPFTYTITEPEDVKDFEIHIIKYKH